MFTNYFQFRSAKWLDPGPQEVRQDQGHQRLHWWLHQEVLGSPPQHWSNGYIEATYSCNSCARIFWSSWCDIESKFRGIPRNYAQFSEDDGRAFPCTDKGKEEGNSHSSGEAVEVLLPLQLLPPGISASPVWGEVSGWDSSSSSTTSYSSGPHLLSKGIKRCAIFKSI